MILPKLAIFDMDGVLFDTERIMYEANTEVRAEHGYGQDFDLYLTTMGTAGDTFFQRLYDLYGPEYPAHEISEESARRAHARVRKEGPPVKEGIPELLQFFRNAGVRCCVASSTRSDTVRTYLSLSGLTEFFDFVLGGEQVTRSKPDPEVILCCLERAGVTPAEACVFEDSENGILAAVNAGVPVVCIVDMKTPSPEIAEKTDALVYQATEVPPLFPTSS
ncbi:MAG: HAD family phosphatase [Clostridia bacterium]|nr:HAD family phosphatase [Clostridia bacterium]